MGQGGSVELMGILTAIVAVGVTLAGGNPDQQPWAAAGYGAYGSLEARGPKRPTGAARGDPGGGKGEPSGLAGLD